ncbi:uncharacterized protein RAG0_17052 [Rhynchosporium agropyri]|uniref:Uncharacterized protein n=1 Tax=Rhynchosporium agropyri TaxID=914238 RepID=A0A1E1LSS7_9HELO|nr:uncharacterized protein RAG0_17052 [Rhynchosporium agropyri]
MVDEDAGTKSIVPQGLEHLIRINTEYQKVICIGDGCGCAKEISTKKWVQHLRGHAVPRDIAEKVSSFIKGLEWNMSLTEAIPPHGLAPQPGIQVIDGVRCTQCRLFVSTSTIDVKDHWETAGHDPCDGCLVELVRIQTWGKIDHEQRYSVRTFWEVDEDAHRSSAEQARYTEVNGYETQTSQNTETDDWEDVSNDVEYKER